MLRSYFGMHYPFQLFNTAGDTIKKKSLKEWSAYQWEEIKKSSDKEVKAWTIYSRKVKGTNFLEYKIEGDIAASPEACVASFRQDIHDQADDSNNKKYPTYEIVHESKDSLSTYVIHNEPFPLKDTEMSVKYIFSTDENGSTGVSWHEAWDESPVQPSKKLNRVQTFRGYWEFSSTPNNSCKASNGVQFDPKKMPLWLVQPMVCKFLRNGLEDISEMTCQANSVISLLKPNFEDMKAVVCTKYGPPEVLQVKEIEKPSPSVNEVR